MTNLHTNSLNKLLFIGPNVMLAASQILLFHFIRESPCIQRVSEISTFILTGNRTR
jgi:hypothetical protein